MLSLRGINASVRFCRFSERKGHVRQRDVSSRMSGKKIEWMRTNPKVCVLVEEMVSLRQWRSVVIHGHFQALSREAQWRREYLHAWSLLEKHTNWWEPGGLKPTTPEIASEIASGNKHAFYSIDIMTAGDQDE